MIYHLNKNLKCILWGDIDISGFAADEHYEHRIQKYTYLALGVLSHPKTSGWSLIFCKFTYNISILWQSFGKVETTSCQLLIGNKLWEHKITWTNLTTKNRTDSRQCVLYVLDSDLKIIISLRSKISKIIFIFLYFLLDLYILDLL